MGPEAHFMTPRLSKPIQGRGSSLLAIARRKVQGDESDMQIALVEALVGKARKGLPRQPGDGLTGKYPELGLLYAINPNKGGNRGVASRGKAKAMGLLRGMPDLCLPVSRMGWNALYLECKTETGRVTIAQSEIHRRLRAADNCVAMVTSVQDGVDTVIRYLKGIEA